MRACLVCITNKQLLIMESANILPYFACARFETRARKCFYVVFYVVILSHFRSHSSRMNSCHISTQFRLKITKTMVKLNANVGDLGLLIVSVATAVYFSRSIVLIAFVDISHVFAHI